MFRLKTPIIAAVALLAAGLTAGSAFAQQYSKEEMAAHRKLYQQVVAERAAGQLVSAEAKARLLARARPGDPYMRRLLVGIQNQRRDLRMRPHWQRTLGAIIVPKVDIEGASLGEVLEYIRVKAEAGSGGRGSPSFVVRGKEVGEREITLKLRNVPLAEVLRYAGELGDVRFSYEKYAIVVKDTRRAPAAGGSEVAKAAETGAGETAKAEPDPPVIKAEAEEFPAVLNFRAPSVARYAGGPWRG